MGRQSGNAVERDMTASSEGPEAFLESEERREGPRESADRLRTLNQDIVHMLMIMSHDIRGPLVALAATVKLLLRGSYGNMDESVRNTLGDMEARVIRLLGVAEDFLGKTHALDGSLKIERETMDLRQDIIDPVLSELANDIEQREIVIDNRLGAIPAGRILVRANKIWLKTVFRNLFTNAIKYGGKGCRIAFGFEDHGACYRLNVYNSGTPIPSELQGRLFTKFFRGETEGKEHQDGVGLGLYLIKEIIHRHGGEIWYEARHDGSDFIFTIAKETPLESEGTCPSP